VPVRGLNWKCVAEPENVTPKSYEEPSQVFAMPLNVMVPLTTVSTPSRLSS
jgi:hypothetical protein